MSRGILQFPDLGQDCRPDIFPESREIHHHPSGPDQSSGNEVGIEPARTIEHLVHRLSNEVDIEAHSHVERTAVQRLDFEHLEVTGFKNGRMPAEPRPRNGQTESIDPAGERLLAESCEIRRQAVFRTGHHAMIDEHFALRLRAGSSRMALRLA